MEAEEDRVGELCAELDTTRQTLYRHVNPLGQSDSGKGCP